MIKACALDLLFDRFLESLTQEGLLLKEGSIIDATVVQTPVQRNSRKENDQIKENKPPPKGWSKNKRAQKDTDARWGSKHGKYFFGYKNSIKIDRHSKLIEDLYMSTANEHDSQALSYFADPQDTGKQYITDSAYPTPDNVALTSELGISLQAVEQNRRNRPLTHEQKVWNYARSKIGARVEHVFGHMKMCIKGRLVRTIGMDRAHAHITLMNLTYNMQRMLFLKNPTTRSLRQIDQNISSIQNSSF